MIEPISSRTARPGALLVALALAASPFVTGCAGAASSTVVAMPAAADCAGGGANAASADASISALSWPKKLDHPSTPETQRRAVSGLFDVMHLQQVLEVALDNAIKVQMEANPKIRPLESVMRKFMAKYLSLEGVREPMTKLYVDRFSELEILQLTAFYHTTLGQRTLAELPKIMEEGSKIGLTLVKDHMAELQQMVREHLEQGGGGP